MIEEKYSLIEEADTSSFILKVVEESKNKLVIVDFWATWCNPCKQLTPILEKVIMQMNGEVKLVKIDIDQNQALAQQMRIQSVPTILVFSDGKPINGFTGLKSEEEVSSFIMEVVSSSEHSSDDIKNINLLLEAAEKKLQDKDFESAAHEYSSLLGASIPKKEMVRAINGLGKCYLGQNKFNELSELIEQLEDDIKEENEIKDLIKSKNYLENIEVNETADLELKLKDNPNDFETRYEVARTQIVNKNYSEAIRNLLFIIEKNKDWNKSKAKKELLDLFSLLGDSDPLTLEGRTKLSNLIFK
jgi:putative thioredoxin